MKILETMTSSKLYAQIQAELAENLRVTQKGISNRLKTMAIVQQQGNWIPSQAKKYSSP